jgi:hypothetical protein
MSQSTLRNWGVGVGGALLVGALSVAMLNGEPASTVAPPPPVAGPLPTAPPVTSAPPVTAEPAKSDGELVFEPAATDAPAPATAPLSFIVRFDEGTPLARAQNLAASGRDVEARRAAENALRRDRAMRGLCFDRFTVGGAEIVLKPCQLIVASRQDAERQRLLDALRAAPGVTYAESNAILNPEAGRTP